jgi:hypothetical protein
MAEARGDCNREKRRFFPDRGRARLPGRRLFVAEGNVSGSGLPRTGLFP